MGEERGEGDCPGIPIQRTVIQSREPLLNDGCDLGRCIRLEVHDSIHVRMREEEGERERVPKREYEKERDGVREREEEEESERERNLGSILAL